MQKDKSLRDPPTSGDIAMVTSNKTYVMEAGDTIEMDCRFSSPSGSFNIFSNPVLWNKLQPFDEEINKDENGGGGGGVARSSRGGGGVDSSSVGGGVRRDGRGSEDSGVIEENKSKKLGKSENYNDNDNMRDQKNTEKPPSRNPRDNKVCFNYFINKLLSIKDFN